MNSIENLLEACARAIHTLLEQKDLTSEEMLAIIVNTNRGIFGEREKIPEDREELKKILRCYIQQQEQKFANKPCDACGCTPCDCHWGII